MTARALPLAVLLVAAPAFGQERAAEPAARPAGTERTGGGADGRFTLASGALTLGDGARLATAFDLAVEPGAALDATGATLAFTGSAPQALTAPGPLTVAAVEVDKPGATLTLGPALTLTRDLALTAGTLDPGGAVVTLTTTVAGGAVTRIATTTNGAGGLVGDLVYERTFVEGGAGWRMVAFPFAGVPLAALADDFAGPGGSGPPLVYRHDDAAQAWVQVTALDAPNERGRGYIVFSRGEALPVEWDLAGQEHGAFRLALVANESVPGTVDPEASYNYVGNPYAGVLDWAAIAPAGGGGAGGGLATTYWTWDPALGTDPDYGGSSGFVFYNSSGGTGTAGRHIAPMQGFFVQATDVAPAIDFDYGLEANDAVPVYAGRTGGGRAPQVRFALSGEGLVEPGAYVVFADGAGPGRDPYDVTRLAPLAADYAALWFAGPGGVGLAVDGRSMAAGAEAFELFAGASRPGTYVLSWPELHAIPDGWRLTLRDRVTGEEVDLREHASHTFTLEGEPAAADGRAAAPRPPSALRATGAARFELRVGDGVTTPADEGPGELPASFALENVAPNPFATTARVRYALPEPATVTLVAFDLLGREVARLAEGPQEAGRHTATLDGHGLAGGVYLVRLTAETAGARFVETRRALLVK